MSNRHQRTGQRLQAAREHEIIRYVYGNHSQRVQAAREQSILRYV